MIIDSEKKLNNFKSKIKKKKYLYLDTEFSRKNTYKATLSFITIYDGKSYYILDAIKSKKLIKLFIQVISNKSILKVLHGSEQDLELLNQYFGEIWPVFDNQLAAGFCGFDRNLSYQNLTKIICKKKIDKKFQNINWLKRPINPKIINYIKNDTKYLKPTHKHLNKILIKTKKLKFFNEEMKIFQINALNPIKISSTLKRNIDKNILDNKEFKKILWIRNSISKKKNLPKNWVLNDNDIVKLVHSKSDHLLKRNSKISKKNYLILLKSFKYLRRTKNKKTVIDQTLIASMNYIKLIISRKNKIDENLIATKNDIYTYLAYKKFNGLWRKKVFFDKYERFIKGKTKVKFKKGIIQI